jgi:fatty acid amide hydrolase 2
MHATDTIPTTQRSAVQLARAIRAGETTAEQVVYEHCVRLHEAQPRTNALTLDRFDEAMADARAADERVARARQAGTLDDLPPLLGVPCTVKESIAYAGLPQTAGLVSRRDHRAEATAPTVQRVLDAGAIPLGVTNVSQLTMWIESDNRLYGRTRNAYDPHRIAGGSRAARARRSARAARRSASARTSAARSACPPSSTASRAQALARLVPNSGQFPHTDGDAARMLSIGPLARRAEDLMPVLGIIAGPDGADRRCVERALGDPADVAIDGLRVLLNDDGSYLPPSKAMRDARDRAAQALADAGAKVESVSLRAMRRALELYLATLGAGAGVRMADLVADEEAEAGLRAWRDAARGRGRTRCRCCSRWASSGSTTTSRRAGRRRRSRRARRSSARSSRRSATASCSTRRSPVSHRATTRPWAGRGC